MNTLGKILTQTSLALSLLTTPIYSQTTIQEQLKEEIKTEAVNRAINWIVENSIKKPERDKLVEKDFQDIKQVRIDDPQLFLPLIPIYLQSKNDEGIETRKASPFLVSIEDKKEFVFGFGMKNSVLLMSNNLMKKNKDYFNPHLLNFIRGTYLQEVNNQEVLRIDQTETRVYFLHYPSIKIKQILEDANYVSGKQEPLKSLKENPNRENLIQLSEKATILSLQTMLTRSLAGAFVTQKIPQLDLNQYYESIKNRYKIREQEVMTEFAKEINPEYEVTKIELYPSRIFGETEVMRVMKLSLEKPTNQQERPFAIYIKPVFEGNSTINGTEKGTLEGILLDGSY